MNVRNNILLSAIIGISSIGPIEGQENPPNILFIGVDDLNCDFGAYGNPYVKSPNLDDLANEGVMFANNHAQKAVCGPSRASLLSGFTPEHTGITGFNIYLRDLYPDLVTLPQFFKNMGYNTVGMGKIHDPRNVSESDKVDLVSWTKFLDINGNRYAVSSGKPVVEMADVSDEDYTDGLLAQEGIKQISELSAQPEPFFLAVGFKKPHLPFAAPKKYWDLYDRDSIPLAPFRKFAENDRAFVHNPGAEFRNNYDNVPIEGEFPYDLQREYIHGYYACVSYIDKLVGELIDALKQAGAFENTIIVLWGDHGFSLGDHTNWGKHTNFEYATRCPLIIAGPGIEKSNVVESPSELLDIYPTLVDLAGYSVPDTLDGNSLEPILTGEKEHVKSFAVSQFRRDGNQGFALRSDYYQYVEWRDNGMIQHQQLFNFVEDPYQTRNLYLDPTYQEIQDTFSFRLNKYLENGENTAPFLFTANTDSLNQYRQFNKLDISALGREGNKIVPLNGAIVTIGDFSLPASEIGYSSAHLPSGNYNYAIEMPDFYPVSGTLDLANDTLLSDTLVRKFYSLDLVIQDTKTGLKLTGATVEVGDQVLYSGLDGGVDLSLEPGNHILYISKENYINKQIALELDADTLITIALKPAFVTLKFRLSEELTPVNNADIYVNESLEITNSLGIATFSDLPVDSFYSWSVNKEGYEPITGELILESDTTIEIEMIPETYLVIFEIRDTSDLSYVTDAETLFESESLLSDESGIVEYENIPAGSYNYEILKDGYEPEMGNIVIAADTTVIIYLHRPVFTNISHAKDLIISPVPARDFINIKTRENVLKFHILNIQGKSLLSGNFDSSDIYIDISKLNPGMYFIYLKISGGNFVPILFAVTN